MIFLYWFLGTLVGYACRYLFFLIKYRKGFLPHIKNKDSIIRDAVNAGFSYVIGFLLLLVIFIAAGRYDHYSTFLYFLSISLIVMFIDPWGIIKNWKEKKPKAKKWIGIAFCAVALLGETFYFNRDSISDSKEPIATYSLTSENVRTRSEIFEDGHVDINGNICNVYILDVAGEADNLELIFADAVSTTLEVNIRYRDGSSTSAYDRESSYTNYASYTLNTTDELFNILGIPAMESTKDIWLRINVNTTRYITMNNIVKLSGISVSSPIPFSYSAVRMMGILSIALFFLYLPEIAGKYKEMEKEVKKAPYILFGGMAVVGIAVVYLISIFNANSFYLEYPLADGRLGSSSTDIYVSMFDALMKGQLHLDIQPSDALIALEDPYIPSARSGISYLWDHCFYNGKYYCYYGILPVLLVSFPLYLLSGCRYVPNAFLLELMGAVILIPAFLLLLLEIYRFVAGKVNWRNYIILALFALPCSMMILLITFTDGPCHGAVYHSPILYGLLNMDLFLSFALIAKRRSKQRMLMLGLCGLTFVFIMMSRPSLFLSVFLALPLFISILREKEDPFKKRILSFAPMAGVLLVGAIFVCWYNYARFGSIFEFGSSYQLTLADCRQYNYSLAQTLPTFIHYFLQAPSFYAKFPYIASSTMGLSFDTSPYLAGSMGIFWFPAFVFGILVLPFLFIGDKENRARQAISILLPLVVVASAFTNYAKGGGTHPRYLIEIYHLCTLAAVMAFIRIIELSKKLSPNSSKPLAYVLGGGFAVFLVSAFLTLNLSFDNYVDFSEGDVNGFFLIWKEAFRSLNY